MKYRKARNQYRCHTCHGTIKKGDLYLPVYTFRQDPHHAMPGTAVRWVERYCLSCETDLAADELTKAGAA